MLFWGRELTRAERMSPYFSESSFLAVLLAIPSHGFMPELFLRPPAVQPMKLSGNRRRHCGYVGKTAGFRSVEKIVCNYLMVISSDCYKWFSLYFLGCLVHISTMPSLHRLLLSEFFKSLFHEQNLIPAISSSFCS